MAPMRLASMAYASGVIACVYTRRNQQGASYAYGAAWPQGMARHGRKAWPQGRKAWPQGMARHGHKAKCPALPSARSTPRARARPARGFIIRARVRHAH